MNSILENSDQMDCYTDLRLVFHALGGRQQEFNWLVTELECNHHPDPNIPYDPERRPLWITGEQLTKIVFEHDIQFMWGVLSGFDKDTIIHLDNLVVEPYADGNPDLWQGCPKIQHPKARVEIVCWDSTCTLLLSKDDDLTFRFRSFFTDARDLDDYNALL